ncbi:hypothetical protein EVAR_63630_1, partial [Eumeta japonica]
RLAGPERIKTRGRRSGRAVQLATQSRSDEIPRTPAPRGTRPPYLRSVRAIRLIARGQAPARARTCAAADTIWGINHGKRAFPFRKNAEGKIAFRFSSGVLISRVQSGAERLVGDPPFGRPQRRRPPVWAVWPAAGGGGCVYLCASYLYRMRTGKRNRHRRPDSPDPNPKSKRDDISINQLT